MRRASIRPMSCISCWAFSALPLDDDDDADGSSDLREGAERCSVRRAAVGRAAAAAAARRLAREAGRRSTDGEAQENGMGGSCLSRV